MNNANKEKIEFVNKKLKWGYLADITKYYHSVFDGPDLCGWTQKEEKEWPMYVGIIELLNRDVRGVNYKMWSAFVSKLKKYNLHITAHDSFMKNDFYNSETDKSILSAEEFFSSPEHQAQGNIINMFWYVVPKSYNSALPAFEKTIQQGIDNIEFAKKYGADRITMHVTKPGIMLDNDAFNSYLTKWKVLHEEGIKKGVKVLVETGGITQNQILKLRDEGAYFNLDTAHAFIDGIDVLQLYNLIGSQIREIHLSMTKDGKNYHAGVNYTGEGYSPKLRKINESIARKVSERQLKGDDITLILEVSPSEGDVDFLYNALWDDKNE